MAAKKTERDALKAALLEEQVAELCLKDYSLRHIMRKLKLKHPEEVRRIMKKVQKRWENEAVEHAKLMLEKDLRRLALIASEAWEAYERSVGKKQKKTSEVKGVVLKEKGKAKRKKKPPAEGDFGFGEIEAALEQELARLGGLSEHKDKTIVWHDAGDPRFLKIAMDCLVERNRLLGTYDKTEDDGDDPLEAVRFLQDIYIPGLGMLTKELLTEMMAAAPAYPGDAAHG